MTTVWKPHVTVATVVPRDGRYLCVEERVRGREVINQPAGHLEPNESLVEAAAREALEESGYEVSVEALIGIYRWRSPVSEEVILRFAFHAEAIQHHPDRPLDDGILRTLWLTHDELAARPEQLRSEMVVRIIADFERGRRFPLDVLHEMGAALGLDDERALG